MSTPEQASADIRKLIVNIEKTSRIAVTKNASVLRTELATRSPVDSGRYQSSWRIEKGKPSPGVIASSSVYNRTKYGKAIEEGSGIGEMPWKSAKSPKTEKATFEGSSRIWSSQAVGGTVGPLFADSRGRALITKLASDVSRGIKW